MSLLSRLRKSLSRCFGRGDQTYCEPEALPGHDAELNERVRRSLLFAVRRNSESGVVELTTFLSTGSVVIELTVGEAQALAAALTGGDR
jgi:hypothetical protein